MTISIYYLHYIANNIAITKPINTTVVFFRLSSLTNKLPATLKSEDQFHYSGTNQDFRYIWIYILMYL